VTWIRLDDSYLEHPKFRRLLKIGGPNALYLWHGALAWCAQHLTDGVIPADMLDEPRGPARGSARERAWEALVTVGLCTRAETEPSTPVHCRARVQHTLHDYADYQPTASAVRAGRADAARRKQLSRNKGMRAQSLCDAASVSDSGENVVSLPRAGDPLPQPNPDLLPDPGPVPAKTLRGRRVAGLTGVQRLEDDGPAAYHTLDGWDPPEELVAEAAMLGIPGDVFSARLSSLRNGPIGGARGVFDRTDYVRQLLPKWRTWSETERHHSGTGGSAPATLSLRTALLRDSAQRFERALQEEAAVDAEV
jgi:hypothetical protein